jgi:hypothetical protein
MGSEDTGLVCGAPRTSVGQRLTEGMKICVRTVMLAAFYIALDGYYYYYLDHVPTGTAPLSKLCESHPSRPVDLNNFMLIQGFYALLYH